MVSRCRSDAVKPFVSIVCTDDELRRIKRDLEDERLLQERNDIVEMLEEASVRARHRSNYPELSYEQGVLAALEWVMGGEDHPLID